MTSDGLLMEFAGSAVVGQSMTLTSSRVIVAPTSRSAAATTTDLVGIDVVCVGCFCTYLYVPQANTSPAEMAMRRTINPRARFMAAPYDPVSLRITAVFVTTIGSPAIDPLISSCATGCMTMKVNG